MKRYDFCIVGSGIVGLSTALALSRLKPGSKIALLEKEPTPALHQTGHNSGVIHSGIYYKPGSLKASLCVQGAKELKTFCKEQGIPTETCGKLIVAVSSEELPKLAELFQRAKENGVEPALLIDADQIQAIEPHAAGIRAIHLPQASIVDYKQVAQALHRLLAEQGQTLLTSTKVLKVTEKNGSAVVETTQGEFTCSGLISCAGLHSDRVAQSSAGPLEVRIIPFRGEYYELSPKSKTQIRGLIYPVPDPRFPFLGVHFTRRIDGKVEIGPNAVLALKREGYRKTDFSLADSLEMLRFPGWWRMTARYWRTGIEEIGRSLSKTAFLKAAQRLVPSLKEEDLVGWGSGVRAQAVGTEGNLLDDFYLLQKGRCLHLLNAPSPAATASLAIGDHVARAALGLS